MAMTTYSEAVEQTITAGEQIHQIVNGTATTEVTVEDGSKVPSIRKALLDNFYFKDPIAWQVGQTENVFNQLRQFTDGSWWYAPTATASNPISMGSTPVGDPMWKVYSFDAIGKLTPQIRESLRRSYAEAGYNLVNGSFEAGGELVNANDVLLQESTGKAFSGPAGTVAAGTNPVGNINWKPVTDQTLRGELLSGAMEIRNNLMSLRDTNSVRDYGAIGGGIADDTAAFIASVSSGKPALVPFPIVKLTSDVAGKFYSYEPVKITGTGYARISLLPLGDERPNSDSTGKLEVYAHRGFALQAPQNTILAFSQAIHNGADGLEMDLQFSSDGVLYVFHDTTVDTLTNGSGTFTALTSTTIDGLLFDSTVGTPFADESIPRFEEVLKLARRAGVKLSVEMKGTWTNPQMVTLINLLTQYGYNNKQCTVIAGYIVYCQDIRALSSEVGVSYVHAGNLAATIPFIDKLKVINGTLAIDQNYILAEPNIVTYAYSKGVDVSTWTIISAEQAKLVADIGVRKIVSDVSFGGTV